MQKPITIRREETAKELAQTIQDSGLPAFVLVDILEYLKGQLQALAKQQYEMDLRRYNEELEQENENQ